MQDIPEEQRPKFFLACIIVLLLAYVAGNWAATQYIADHYAYSENLSGALFGSKLYHPFALKMWQEIEERIAKHIEERGPWFLLLVHPKVAEAAANIYNGAKETSASILQTAQTAMAVYQDPLIRKNTAVSDFTLRDLLDPRQEVSLYLVLQPNDIDKLRPILRLFVNTMLSKLVRDMEFEEQQKGA